MATTEEYKKIFQEKCPPKTVQEQVYASIILDLSAKYDRLFAQTGEIKKAVKFLAVVVKEMGIGEEKATEVSPTAPVESGPTDKTPFPVGVSPTVNAAPVSAAPASAPPATPVEEIPTPDAGSMRGVNAQPIPNAPAPPTAPKKNNTKGVQA